jgi:hypothetical protein
MTKEKEKEQTIRQVVLTGMNESVSILSGYESEDLNFLSMKALELYKKIKPG